MCGAGGISEKDAMTTDEYRALVEAGPAVVMVAKADMLRLLERLMIAEQELTDAERRLDMVLVDMVLGQ
jgi:hypothetical protein